MEPAGTDGTGAPSGLLHRDRDLRVDGARNRAKVLAAARRVLHDGDPSLPMNVVARAAGVGIGTVYRHFPTRQVLLEDLAADSFARLLDRARAAASEPDPSRGLAQLLGEALDCLIDDVALGAVLRSGDITCEHTTAVLTDLMGAFSGLLERARASGAVRAGATPDDLRRYLLGLETAARLTDTGDGPDLRRTRADLEVLVAGLRPGG